MSLQIWLPLDGNLNNYGVSGLTFSNVSSSNTTVSTSGKIGSCYNNNSFTAGGLVSNKTINLGTKQSMFCWVKFTSFNSEASLSGICGQHRYSNCTGMGITAKYNTSTTGYVSVNTGNGSDRTYVTYAGNTLMTAGNWYHIGYTYDGTTIKLYLNGRLDGTHTVPGMAVPADFFQVFSWSFNSGTVSDSSLYGGYKTQSSINDVRVYDHCLSEKEVREISQGLIFHLPLRNPMYESTTNIARKPIPQGSFSPAWNASLHPNALTIDGWSEGYNSGVSSPATGYHAHWKLIDEIPTIVFPNINSTISSSIKGRWLGISHDYTLHQKFSPGVTYTVSFDARGSVDGMTINTGLYYNNGSSTNFHDGTTNTIINTSWARYSYTSTVGANFKTSAEASFYFYGHYGIEGISYVRNIQIEFKDHETSFTPSTRAITTMDDCSGFKRTATITGDLSFIKSPEDGRNEYDAVFNGSTYLRTSNMTIPTAHTISLWINRQNHGHVLDWRSTASGEPGIQPMYINESGNIQYYSSAASSAASDYFTDPIPANSWHHVVLACNGTTVKYYLDGELKGSKSTSIGNWSNPLSIGARTTNANIIKAKLSDLRIYATELSAADISTLYNARAAVDSKHNCWAYEFIQEDTGSMKVYNSGVWNFADMLETDDGEDTSIYEI